MYYDSVCGVLLLAIYALSGASLDNGIAEWDISNILPEECYAKYYLQLFQCKIENFAVLPEVGLNIDDVEKLLPGESILFFLHFIESFSYLEISASMSPNTRMVTGGSSNYEVDLGDCITGIVYTSITRLDMQPVSGHLILYSATSTNVCSFTLESDFVPSISPQIIICNMTSKFYSIRACIFRYLFHDFFQESFNC